MEICSKASSSNSNSKATDTLQTGTIRQARTPDKHLQLRTPYLSTRRLVNTDLRAEPTTLSTDLSSSSTARPDMVQHPQVSTVGNNLTHQPATDRAPKVHTATKGPHKTSTASINIISTAGLIKDHLNMTSTANSTTADTKEPKGLAMARTQHLREWVVTAVSNTHSHLHTAALHTTNTANTSTTNTAEHHNTEVHLNTEAVTAAVVTTDHRLQHGARGTRLDIDYHWAVHCSFIG